MECCEITNHYIDLAWNVVLHFWFGSDREVDGLSFDDAPVTREGGREREGEREGERKEGENKGERDGMC